MRRWALLLALLMLCPAIACAGNELTIVLATDLHYISPQLTDNGAYFERITRNGDGKVSLYSEELTEAFIEQMLQKKPDAVILSGDLTFNGAVQSHKDLAQKLARLEDAGIDVLVMPGNHDLYNFDAAHFEGDGFTRVESATAESFESIYAPFGFDDALSRDSVSLSYMAELSPTLRVLMLDVNTERYTGSVRNDTLAWAAQQLQAAKEDGARVIAVSHQNLLQHNPLFSGGFVIMNNTQLLTQYVHAGVLLNLSGHMHVQHIASSSSFTEIATSSLAVSPNQYGVITVTDGALHYRTEAVDVSAWAQKKALSDPNLLDFAAYSEDFFKGIALSQAETLFSGSKQARQIAQFYADVNADYFAGRMHKAVWDEALYEKMLSSEFFSGYMTSIREELGVCHTELILPLN